MSIDSTLARVLRCDGGFKDLLLIAGLDPSQDLRGCDFSNVDFGDLSALKIDLTNCNLYNADLSKVEGRLILNGAHCAGAKFKSGQITSISPSRLELRARFDLIKRAIISVHRFQISYSAADQIKSNFDWGLPIVLLHRSPVERDRLQTEIRNELGKILLERADMFTAVKGEGVRRARFIEVRADNRARKSVPANREAADIVFFHSLVDAKSEALVDVSMDPHGNPKITDHTAYGNPIDSRVFSRFSLLGTRTTNTQISREAFRQLIKQITDGCTSAIFFNDTALFSADMAKMLRKKRPGSCYVFLLNQDLISDPVRQAKKSNIWPNFIYIKPRVIMNEYDVRSFIENLKAYESAGLFISEETLQYIQSYRGRPSRELKNMMIAKLRDVLNDRRYSTEKFTVV